MEIISFNRVPKPKYFKTIERAMAEANPADGHGIELLATIDMLDSKGHSEGRESFECKSFVANFMKMLFASMVGGQVDNVVDIWNTNHTIDCGYSSTFNNWFDCAGTTQYEFFRGPIIGGSSADNGGGANNVLPTDYKLTNIIMPTSDSLVSQPQNTGEIPLVSAKNCTEASSTVFKQAGQWHTGWNFYKYCLLNIYDTSQNMYFVRPILQQTNAATSSTVTYAENTIGLDSRAPIVANAIVNLATSPADTAAIFTYGQLNFGSTVSFTQTSESNGNINKLAITRTFTNNTTADFVIKEFGLICLAVVTTPTGLVNFRVPILIIRDVYDTGYTILHDPVKTLSLTYTITVTA